MSAVVELGVLAGGDQLRIPDCAPGIGQVILSPTSADLIAGVCLQPFPLWPDDRGYFLEVARLGQGLVAGFPASSQISTAVNYPGVIKAFHYHRRQTDYWVPAAGLLQVALVDMRAGSATYGAKNTIFAGTLRPWQILIPPGVAHGYKVVGEQASVLVYVTDRTYDPADEGRIRHDDSSMAYDWELQHK